MRNIFFLLLLFVSVRVTAQVDSQERYFSDSRQYFVWSDDAQSYLLKETEYEHSLLDIREIGSRSNGYVAISLTDNGRTRLFHGSIAAFTVNGKKEPTWQLRSKTMRSKLTFNPEERTFTYVYDADDKRYRRILVFSIKPDEEMQAQTPD